MKLVARELLITGDPAIRSVIYLNGEKQRDVIIADDDLGFVEHYCRDIEGKYLVAQDGCSIKTATLFGVVKIVNPSI